MALLDLAHEGLVELRTSCSARTRVVAIDEAVALAGQRLSIGRPWVVRAAERFSDAGIRAFYVGIAGMPAAARLSGPPGTDASARPAYAAGTGINAGVRAFERTFRSECRMRTPIKRAR